MAVSNGELYKDALDNVSAFNARLCYERKMRVPFLDAQTGIAMINSNLWLSKMMRRPGTTPHYIYSYPARRWRKKKKKARNPLRNEEEMTADKEQDIAMIEEVENVEEAEEMNVPSTSQEARKEMPVKEIEAALPEHSDDEEAEQETGPVSTDDEEFEIINVKRKRGRPGRKKRPPTTAGPIPVPMQVKNISKEELAKMDPEERKKPYVCEICGKRYKNGPGLKYHYIHYNHEQDTSVREEEAVSHPSTPNPVESTAPFPSRGPGRPRKEVSFPPQIMHQVTPPPLPGPRIVAPNNYCDFCLGDITENKKSGRPEELLSCADCGRSGHPTCLQFTARLTESVKKYKWQCIECKSCTKCGTSDNDDQLLFCDDCDRGYHMYCLRPPMEHPPEGHWTCQLCKDAIHLSPYPITGTI